MPKNPMILDRVTLKNGGSIKTVGGTEIITVDSSGTPSLKANIQDTLAQGSIYIGNSSNITSELDISTDTGVLVGNGTTAAVQTLSGDASMTNAGVVTVTGSTGAFAATGDLTNASGVITSTKTDDGATGAVISARQVSASPAASDIPGAFSAIGKDDGGNDATYVQYQGVISDPTDGAEIGYASVQVQNGTGSLVEALRAGHNGSYKTLNTGIVQTDANNGTAGTGVTASEYGDGYNHVTVLTFSALALPAITAGAAEAHGYKIYEFPAGAHAHKVTYMNVALQGGGTIDADTPDVGIGSVIGAGAVSVLGGTATFEDYITGQTAADCGGTATVFQSGATAGYGTGISMNAVGDVKDVYLNYADTWAGADTIAATGTVILEWTFLE